MSAAPETMRALARLLGYPTEQTVQAAELLYVLLQDELPEAARRIAEFGEYLERHELSEVEEAFTRTFDVNPACALEIGWHLFGEEYARGMFLVRMRGELRKYSLPESVELPDHVTHVLAVVAAMPDDDARRFVQACVLPAVRKMELALDATTSAYRPVVSCLAAVLQHAWGAAEPGDDRAAKTHADADAIPAGVDPLHAFPVADIHPCAAGCGPRELVQLSVDCGRSGDSRVRSPQR